MLLSSTSWRSCGYLLQVKREAESHAMQRAQESNNYLVAELLSPVCVHSGMYETPCRKKHLKLVQTSSQIEMVCSTQAMLWPATSSDKLPALAGYPAHTHLDQLMTSLSSSIFKLIKLAKLNLTAALSWSAGNLFILNTSVTIDSKERKKLQLIY